MNRINAIILSQSLKLNTFKHFEKKICKKNVQIQIVVIENDIVCFMLKGAENLPARGRKTEKSITLVSSGLVLKVLGHHLVM
jgi:hypothetical protein